MHYDAVYKNRTGDLTVNTFIHNDGKNLSMEILGLKFSGPDFDGLEYQGETPIDPSKNITLHPSGFLCDCILEFNIPLELIMNNTTCKALLKAHLDLGAPSENGGIDKEELRLELVFENISRVSKPRGFFEDALFDIQNGLEKDQFMKICFNCINSDYSPYGNGLFGDVACFRTVKDEFKRVKSKDDMFGIWDKMTEFVQETHLCSEFER